MERAPCTGECVSSAIHKYRTLLDGANEKAITTAAITEDLDRGVGQVMDSIEQLGLTESTYVIYMSDNGAGGGDKRGALRGGKGGVWEGGLRVPLIVRGPHVAANSWCHVPVVGYDLLPTFCHWADVPPHRCQMGSKAVISLRYSLSIALLQSNVDSMAWRSISLTTKAMGRSRRS